MAPDRGGGPALLGRGIGGKERDKAIKAALVRLKRTRSAVHHSGVGQ